MSHFVVIYDRATGKAQIRSFEGANASMDALEERFVAEGNAGPDEEVTTLTADSIEDLQATHARYFRNAGEMVDDLEKLLAS